MEETQDTKSVPEVRPITKVVYVSIEVPMKDQIFLIHKSPRTITKIRFGSSLSNPHEWDDNTNFLMLTIILVALGGYLVSVGDGSPRVTSTQKLLLKWSCLKVEWCHFWKYYIWGCLQNTSSVATCEKCRERRSMMTVSPICMPWVHIFLEWKKVWYSGGANSQSSSCLS
jgi:hypothetical protein